MPRRPRVCRYMPTLVKGSTAIGLATSGVVIAHLAALGPSGIALSLRANTGYGRGREIMLRALTFVGLTAFAVVGLVTWSSRRGKLLVRDRVVTRLDLRGDEQVARRRLWQRPAPDRGCRAPVNRAGDRR